MARLHNAKGSEHRRVQTSVLKARPAIAVSPYFILFLALVLWLPLQSFAQRSMGAALPLAANSTDSPIPTPPISVTLAQAEQRARKIEPTLRSALAARGSAASSRAIARSTLLPQGSILGEYLFTESNGVHFGGTEPNAPGPVFIANNAVHEYTSQAMATENLSLGSVARYRQTRALALQAQAQAEIALRGLHVVVTQAYYTVEADDLKLQAAQEAEQAAQNFLGLTEKLEGAREVAHADVLKAELQQAQAQRAVADAALLASDARQSFGVLLFPNPETPYTLVDALNPAPGTSPDVPEEGEVRALAAQSNPELRNALEALKAADANVMESRAGYLPTLSLAYNYGLDAPRFEATGPLGQRFLGYSAFAGVNIPVWDWLATRARIQQSELQRSQSRRALDYTQRQLIAQLDARYGELKTAAANLTSLQKSAQQSSESLRLTILQYQAGQAIVLQVVNAENTDVATQSAAADAALRYHVARANLERLTGTLP